MEHNVRQALYPEASEPPSDSETDRNQEAQLQIDVPRLVVGPEREDTNR